MAGKATIMISTTLRKGVFTWAKKIAVLKPGDKIDVIEYRSDWYCKCKHEKYGEGYCIYFANGNVHVSGPGVTDAIKKNGGKKGDKKTGYQTDKLDSGDLSASKGDGKTTKRVTVYKAATKTSNVIGTIEKNNEVTMKHINPYTGWAYVTGYGYTTGSSKASTTTKISGWVQYKTASAKNIKVTKVTAGKYDADELNSQKNLGKDPTKKDKDKDKSDDNTNDDSSTGGGGGTNTGVTPDDTSMNDDFLSDGDPEYYKAFAIKNITSAKSFATSVRGIYGMPYQYMSLVDPKLSDGTTTGNYGRLYSERILERMPLLVVSPGIPVYMPNYSTDAKQNVLTGLIDQGMKGVENILNDIVGKEGDGRFYSFKHAYKEYFDYVNIMCQQLSIYLGIENEEIPMGSGGKKALKSIKWQDYRNAYVQENSASHLSIGFYVDSESQISESLSNSTAESQFASTINSVNDLSREIQFLMGGATGKQFNELLNGNFASAFEHIEEFTTKYSQVIPGLLTSRLKNTFETIKVGGQLVFPEIWNDSDFGKNYDIKIKLQTPDGDKLSWYLNVGVPLMHILGFTAPRALGYNGIQSPFLVRCFYKSFFNVDMGIVTNLNITKGDKNKWNIDGLPLEIEIDMTIKDLYQSFSIAPPEDDVTGFIFGKNLSQMDYIANLCGINVNQPDLMRSVILGWNQAKYAVWSMLTSNGFLGVHQAVDNFKLSLYERFLR